MTSDETPKQRTLSALRRTMVQQQLRRRGILDERVLAAMEMIPRHLFVHESLVDQSYDDRPLAIGAGQTISQPYMVARMTELCALKPSDRVLEVGAGSGYQTAILSCLCAAVYSTEILVELAASAKSVLKTLRIENVVWETRDGSTGWARYQPYQAILVAAGAPAVPPALLEQLADGGRLVIPVGGRTTQILQSITRLGNEFMVREDTSCRFVDLRGVYGWDGGDCS